MNCIGTYDGTIFYNPANKFCIISVKTADQSVPAEARSNRRYKDHLIRFTAVGYEIPRTDAVELELDGEWAKGKYGVQLQVEQWREIVPRTKNGVEGYLASGLIKGIGPKTAADIVERFGVDTLDILEHQPERLLEIRGITENKLEDIKASYAENRMLQGIMTLLAPFKITPKTALKIYQYFGPTSVEILEKSPFELCQISGFGFRRVDAIVQKSGGNLHDPIPMIGNTASKVLGRVFHYDLDEFRDAVYGGYDFRQLPDFGETLHNNIHDWFCVEDNFCIWEELQTMMSIQKPAVAEHSENRVQDNPFVGKTIVVTGKVEPYTRDGINDLIESLGAHAGSSVSKKTDYLVCGENAGSKLSKARDLGVTVLSPAEFFSMAGAE